MRVIASSIRKGNIIEREDGQLCVVLSAESFHPGKGTPTTQIDMRRLSDGVKVTDRFKTTEQVERAFVEDKNYDFLYSDADGYHFMNAETYDQIQVPADVIGDQAQWLQEGMKVILSIFNETPVGIQLPPRVTLEIVETEPAMKGQTASSSYKPAKLSNGARVMVPPHITHGNARRHPDGRRQLRRTRQGLTRSSFSKGGAAMQLGMIGLGRMGANIVRRLMRAGHACVVYDRDPAPGLGAGRGWRAGGRVA